MDREGRTDEGLRFLSEMRQQGLYRQTIFYIGKVDLGNFCKSPRSDRWGDRIQARTTMSKQMTLGAGFEKYSKTTRRDKFLTEMDRIVPWGELCALIAPVYPKAGDGRPPKERR